ncbi:GGDEF domain-containing protein [Thalassotalea sp. M1531]|uniref:diguanylate cyclase n=1 Tax=Thalassotalea algicola TaxID=2716224 RepID=A0A7Y0LDM7_9GAMM|nr:tetratricopeptide repeat-containing diguanylate cyclase [Thalassotalea algicola]NMP32273.1 GGDEF domain-containing protein [Thalassotalea algicola]
MLKFASRKTRKTLKTLLGLVFFAYLVTSKSFAYSETNNRVLNFVEQLEDIRTLSDSDQKSAIEKLKLIKPSLNEFPLNQQLEYYHLLAETHSLLGQHRLARSTAEQALVLASGLISPRIVIAKLAYDLGYSLESLGHLDLALEQYLSGLDVAESLEEQKEIAVGLINVGAIYYQTAKLSEAIITINEALTIAENLSDKELKGLVYSELGILYGSLGEPEKSIEFYKNSYRYYTEADKPLLAINNLRNIASSYRGQGKTDQAIASYNRLLDALEGINHVEMEFSAHVGLATIYADEETKQYDLAIEHLTKTEQLLSQVEHHFLPFRFLIDKAVVYKEMKRYEETLAIVEEALNLFHSKQFKVTPMNEAVLLVLRSETYRLMGRYKEAYDTYLRVYDLNMEDMQNSQTQSVAELRLQYESRRADIENSLLANKSKLESIALDEARENSENKQNYIYYISIIVVIFAILLNVLRKSQRQLLKVSRTDALTQLINRRRFIELANRELVKAKKQKESVALLVIDCDLFKTINDNYGHATGDNALKLLTRLGQQHFAKPEIFGRYGGEEFMVLLPGTTREQAIEKAQHYRKAVSALSWNDENEHLLSVSIGVVTTTDANSYNFEELFELADSLLYQAKEKGRNQVCV